MEINRADNTHRTSRKLMFVESRTINLSISLLFLISLLPLDCSANMVPSMERWSGKIAVVAKPGPTEMALLEDLVNNDMQVIALVYFDDKDIEALSNKVKNKTGSLHQLKVDLFSNEDIIETFELIEEKFGPVSVFYHAADERWGVTLLGDDEILWKWTFELNVIALCTATREAVNSMKKHKIDGHIILKNIIYAQKPFELPGVYTATKHAVTALTETLRAELLRDKTKIKITSISQTSTGESYADTKEYNTLLHPEDISHAIMYVLSTPPHVQVHELTLRPLQSIQRSYTTKID